jgi:hypothetical protein
MMAGIRLIIPLMFCIFNISLCPLRTFSTVLVSVPSLGCGGGFLGTADSEHEGSCLRDRENLKDGVAPKSQDSEGRRLFHNSQVYLNTTRLISAQTSIRSGCIWRNPCEASNVFCVKALSHFCARSHSFLWISSNSG